jgi:putative hydrolase of the HAD superfamily
MGLRKPYPEAFQFILDEQQLNPAETLFIDDTPKNITGAQAVGLQTVFLEKGMEITEIKL